MPINTPRNASPAQIQPTGSRGMGQAHRQGTDWPFMQQVLHHYVQDIYYFLVQVDSFLLLHLICCCGFTLMVRCWNYTFVICKSSNQMIHLILCITWMFLHKLTDLWIYMFFCSHIRQQRCCWSRCSCFQSAKQPADQLSNLLLPSAAWNTTGLFKGQIRKGSRGLCSKPLLGLLCM